MNTYLLPLFALVTALPLSAQEMIRLSDDEVALLGLAFAPATVMQQQAGVNLPGRVINSPESITHASSRHAGILEQWYLAPGEKVAAGDALARLRSPELLQTQQNYLTALSERDRTARRLDRDRSLFDQGIIARQRLLDAESNHRVAQVAVDVAERMLAQAGMSGEDQQALRAGVYDVGSVTLRAPVAGVLSHRAFAAGEYLEANATFATLSQPAEPWLSIQMPVRLLPLLEAGIDLTIPATGQSLTLRQRDHEVDPTSQSLEILAQFDQPATVLPGQLQTVSLHPRQPGIFVPAAAVVREGGQAVVFVRTAQGVEARGLELLAVGSGYLAQSGIRQGEELLIRGAALIKGIQLGLGSDE